MIKISSVSVEYVRVKLTADVELNSQTVELAILSSQAAEPDDGDWHAATWLTPEGKSRTAGVLVGTGGLVLPNGEYWVWFRLTDNPEKPAKRAGQLIIT
ncbi:MAG TPA: hypothetical protein PLB92_00150 [Rhodoglobus sp.]|nr:hypothetical protein [Rhodoglobus sp.]